jgi:hypothetical protein
VKQVPKWQRDLHRRVKTPTPKRATEPKEFFEQVQGEIKTFKTMAAYLKVDERTLRKAYKEDAFVSACISKTGGRYHSDDIALESVHLHLMNRREATPARALHATKQKRHSKGRF